MSLTEFLTMGGYAVYVWPAFGIAALVMAGLLLASRRTLKAREAALEEIESRRAPRRRRTGEEPAP